MTAHETAKSEAHSSQLIGLLSLQGNTWFSDAHYAQPSIHHSHQDTSGLQAKANVGSDNAHACKNLAEDSAVHVSSRQASQTIEECWPDDDPDDSMGELDNCVPHFDCKATNIPLHRGQSKRNISAAPSRLNSHDPNTQKRSIGCRMPVRKAKCSKADAKHPCSLKRKAACQQVDHPCHCFLF